MVNDASSSIEIPQGITKEFLVDKCKHLNKTFSEWFNPHLKSIEDNVKLYNNTPIDGMIAKAVQIPISASVIETTQARFMSSLATRDKLVDAVQKTILPGDMEAEQKLLKVETFINQAIVDTPGYLDKLDEAVKLTLLETVTVFETFWDEEEIEEEKIDREIMPGTGEAVPVAPMPEQGEVAEGFAPPTGPQAETPGIEAAPSQAPEAPKQKEVNPKKPSFTRRRFPNFQVLSIRNMAWDMREKTSLANSPWVRKRSMMSANELLEMQENGVIDNADEVIRKNTKRDELDGAVKDPDAQFSQVVMGQRLPSSGFEDGKYQVDEWWATLVWKAGEGIQRGEFRWWMVNDEEVVKFEKNPRKGKKPFISVKCMKKPGMLMAKGPIDIIKPLIIDIANTMARKNTLIENAANSPTFYEPSSGLDGRRTILQQNALIPVMNVRGIQRSEPPVAAIGLLDQHLGFSINQAREATAANEMAQGIGMSGGGDTATEANLLMQSGSLRFQYTFDMFASQTFPYIAAHYRSMFKSYGLEGEMTVRGSGQDGVAEPVLLQDLEGDYEFRVAISQNTANKMGRFKLLEEVVAKLVQAYKADPMLFTDKDGTPMKVTPFEFITEEMLPLLDIKAGAKLFKKADVPIMPGQIPGGPGLQGAPLPAMPAISAPQAMQ